MRRKYRLTESEKCFSIINKDKMSFGKIAQELLKPKSTIYFFIKRFEERGVINNIKPKGAKKKLRQSDLKRLKSFIKRNPKLNLREIRYKLNLNICLRTLTRYLKSLKIGYYKVHNKSKISAINKRKRYDFCMLNRNRNLSYWKKFCFTDESSCVLGTKYIQKVWRLRGSIYYEEIPKQYSIQYIKIWGSICWNGIQMMIKCKSPFNSVEYCRILKLNFVDNNQNRKYTIIHDGDRRHTSGYTRKFMIENGLKSLENFPPQSADLNILENLWYILKSNVYKPPYPRNLLELEQRLYSEWNKIKLETIQNLFRSMKKRIEMIISAKGGSIKY